LTAAATLPPIAVTASIYSACVAGVIRPSHTTATSCHLMASPGTSWHDATEPSFKNRCLNPDSYAIFRTASEAGGRAFESHPGHHLISRTWRVLRLSPYPQLSRTRPNQCLATCLLHMWLGSGSGSPEREAADREELYARSFVSMGNSDDGTAECHACITPILSEEEQCNIGSQSQSASPFSQ
jgi:hypothetical protein